MGMPTFEGLGKTEVFNKTNRLKLGVWDLEIENVFAKDTREYGWALIQEFKVINNYGNAAHAVGEKVSVYVSLKFESSYKRAIKSFIVAASGVDISTQKDVVEKEFSNDDSMQKLMKAVLEEGLFNGKKIHVDAIAGNKLSAAGTAYPVYNYSPFKKK